MHKQILPYPEVGALNNNPARLIVFLHGVGSDGNDLISLVPFMQKELPDYHFISPHGVEPFDMAPFGRQWFSLIDRDPHKLQKLVAENIPLLAKIIKDKQTELKLTNKDTILIGFSQGTMSGLYLNLIQEEAFLGVVGFSGCLLPPVECINKTTPICLIHGDQDDMVNISKMYEADEYLSRQNIKHIIHKIPNLAHSIDASGINYAINFIKNTGNK